MGRVFLVLLGLCGFCALAFAAQSAAQDVSVQTAQGHWDEHDCFQFEATAKVSVSVDELFQALSRPEKLSAYRPGPQAHWVFVSSPVTKQSMWENTWTVSNPPTAKVIEWVQIWGAANSSEYFWVEYEYNPYSHTIVQHSLGSRSQRSICQPYSDEEYALSPLEAGSSTSVSYTSTDCVPPEERNKPWNPVEVKIKGAKQALSEWLQIAQDDARVVAQERTKKPAAPWPPPGLPLATSTPTVSPSGGVP